MTIDTNCFLGPWPFAEIPSRSGPQLAKYLRSAGIGRALVSHFGALFFPEPMASNNELLRAVRGMSALHPVPILNPALAVWPDHLEACAKAGVAGIVRIAPGYHNYRLGDPRLKPFMAALAARGGRLIVQVRLEDERNGYFGLRLARVRARAVAHFLRSFPEHHVLCCGGYRNEIAEWSKQGSNFSADVSFAESLHTLESLRDLLPASRLLMGTATPLLSPHAQMAKLAEHRLSAGELELIGSRNARRLFSL